MEIVKSENADRGMRLLMQNGSIWFHPFDGGAPVCERDAIPSAYIAISADYSYAVLRVGLVVRRNQDGKEIYCQPGDDEEAMRANIDALDEVSTDWHDSKRRVIADMTLGEYF